MRRAVRWRARHGPSRLVHRPQSRPLVVAPNPASPGDWEGAHPRQVSPLPSWLGNHVPWNRPPAGSTLTCFSPEALDCFQIQRFSRRGCLFELFGLFGLFGRSGALSAGLSNRRKWCDCWSCLEACQGSRTQAHSCSLQKIGRSESRLPVPGTGAQWPLPVGTRVWMGMTDAGSRPSNPQK